MAKKLWNALCATVIIISLGFVPSTAFAGKDEDCADGKDNDEDGKVDGDDHDGDENCPVVDEDPVDADNDGVPDECADEVGKCTIDYVASQIGKHQTSYHAKNTLQERFEDLLNTAHSQIMAGESVVACNDVLKETVPEFWRTSLIYQDMRLLQMTCAVMQVVNTHAEAIVGLYEWKEQVEAWRATKDATDARQDASIGGLTTGYAQLQAEMAKQAKRRWVFGVTANGWVSGPPIFAGGGGGLVVGSEGYREVILMRATGGFSVRPIVEISFSSLGKITDKFAVGGSVISRSGIRQEERRGSTDQGFTELLIGAELQACFTGDASVVKPCLSAFIGGGAHITKVSSGETVAPVVGSGKLMFDLLFGSGKNAQSTAASVEVQQQVEVVTPVTTPAPPAQPPVAPTPVAPRPPIINPKPF